VQLAYAIGVAQPVSVSVNTFGTAFTKKSDAQIAEIILGTYDLRPARIIEELRLKNPIYRATSAYGHFGRDPFVKNGIEYFAWEKLNYADTFKSRLF